MHSHLALLDRVGSSGKELHHGIAEKKRKLPGCSEVDRCEDS
jgi:hypothetical protein